MPPKKSPLSPRRGEGRGEGGVERAQKDQAGGHPGDPSQLPPPPPSRASRLAGFFAKFFFGATFFSALTFGTGVGDAAGRLGLWGYLYAATLGGLLLATAWTLLSKLSPLK